MKIAKYTRKTLLLLIILTLLLGALPLSYGNSNVKKTDYEITHEQMVKDKMTAGKLLLDYGFDVESSKGLDENGILTREDFYKIMISVLGEDKNFSNYSQESFTDMPKTHEAYAHIERAKELGFTNGIGNGLFGTGAPVSARQMLYAFQVIYGRGERYGYSEIYEMTSYSFDIANINPDAPIVRGQLFKSLLVFIQGRIETYITDTDNGAVMNRVPIIQSKKNEFKFKAAIIERKPIDYRWEGISVYKQSPTFGTIEEDNYNFKQYFKYKADYLENSDVYLRDDYEKYEFAYHTWDKDWDKYTQLKDQELERLFLSRELLDPSIEAHKISIKYYNNYDKLKTAYENKANAYKKELSDKNFVYSIKGQLDMTEAIYARLEAFKEEMDYEALRENYKTYSTKEMEDMAYKFMGNYYLFTDFDYYGQSLEVAYKTYGTSDDYKYRDRISELSTLRNESQKSYRFYKGEFVKRGFHNYIEFKEYEFDEDIPVYKDVTKADYDAY